MTFLESLLAYFQTLFIILASNDREFVNSVMLAPVWVIEMGSPTMSVWGYGWQT